MKKIILFLTLALIGSVGQAQNSPLSKGYKKALFKKGEYVVATGLKLTHQQ